MNYSFHISSFAIWCSARGGPTLLSYLLQLLEAPHTIESENMRATIAMVVMAIKAMQQKTVKHTERVNVVLEQSTIWKQYRDQSHDLFITGSAVPLPIARVLILLHAFSSF